MRKNKSFSLQTFTIPEQTSFFEAQNLDKF